MVKLSQATRSAHSGPDGAPPDTGGGISRAALLQLQRRRCYLCDRPFTGVPRGTPDRRRLLRESRVTEDHVFPRRTGRTRLRNKLLAHAACNARKGDRLPHPCEVLFLAAVHALADAATADASGARTPDAGS